MQDRWMHCRMGDNQVDPMCSRCSHRNSMCEMIQGTQVRIHRIFISHCRLWCWFDVLGILPLAFSRVVTALIQPSTTSGRNCAVAGSTVSSTCCRRVEFGITSLFLPFAESLHGMYVQKWWRAVVIKELEEVDVSGWMQLMDLVIPTGSDPDARTCLPTAWHIVQVQW